MQPRKGRRSTFTQPQHFNLFWDDASHSAALLPLSLSIVTQAVPSAGCCCSFKVLAVGRMFGEGKSLTFSGATLKGITGSAWGTAG